MVDHTASSKLHGLNTITTTKIELTVRLFYDFHLIRYVLAALAVADLPGKGWGLFYDERLGTAQFVYIREANELNTGSVVRLWDTLRMLATPTMELSHDT